MKLLRLGSALAGTAACALTCAALWPHARDAAALLAAQNDPVKLSDIRLNAVMQNDNAVISRDIEAALAANDADLANSFVELAQAKNISLDDELLSKVGDAVAEQNSTSHFAKGFASGLVTGNGDDVASMSGTVAGDLFVFGDIRDVVREAKHLVTGEPTDRLVLGLAAAGIAITAATYVSVGGAAPVRAGLTLVKDARKVGRLGEGLTLWAGRSVRDVVNTPMLEDAVEISLDHAAPSNRLGNRSGISARAGGRPRSSRQGCRTHRRKSRHARRARHAESCRRSGRCGARCATCQIQGRADARDPQDTRPRRLVAGDRRVRSDAVGVRRATGAVWFPVVDQGHD